MFAVFVIKVFSFKIDGKIADIQSLFKVKGVL